MKILSTFGFHYPFAFPSVSLTFVFMFSFAYHHPTCLKFHFSAVAFGRRFNEWVVCPLASTNKKPPTHPFWKPVKTGGLHGNIEMQELALRQALEVTWAQGAVLLPVKTSMLQ